MTTAKKIIAKKLKVPETPKPKVQKKPATKKKRVALIPKKNIPKDKVMVLPNFTVETNVATIDLIKGEKATKPKSNAGAKFFNGRNEAEVIAKLEIAFKMGTTVERACLYAEISPDSYYHYCRAYPQFSDKVTAWQENLMLVVDVGLFAKAQKGELDALKFIASRRDRKRYGDQPNATPPDEGILTPERKAEILGSGMAWAKPRTGDERDSDYEN